MYVCMYECVVYVCAYVCAYMCVCVCVCVYVCGGLFHLKRRKTSEESSIRLLSYLPFEKRKCVIEKIDYRVISSD